MWRKLTVFVPFVAAVVAVVLAWEAGVHVLRVPEYLLPAPSQVALRIGRDWRLLGRHAGVTVQEILLGFLAGSIGGFAAAVGMATSRVAQRIVRPFVVISQTLPKEALAPLLLVWLGYGIAPKVAMSALICFFPIAMIAGSALIRVDPLLLDLFRSLAATRVQIFFKLRLPSALPAVCAALKMAMVLSVIGAVVGEFVGSSAGLGHLIQVGNSQLATDLIFAALATLGALASALFLLMEGLEFLVLRRHERVVYANIR